MLVKGSLFIVLSLHFILYINPARIAKKIIVVESYGNCPDVDEEKTGMRIISSKFGMASGSYSELSFKLDIQKNVTNPISGVATVWKCPSLNGEDDCEKFLVVKVKDFCQKFVERNQAWSFVFEKIMPPLRCPVIMGKYEAVGARPDIEKLKWLIDDYHVFKVNLDMKDAIKNEPLACQRIVLRTSVVRLYKKE